MFTTELAGLRHLRQLQRLPDKHSKTEWRGGNTDFGATQSPASTNTSLQVQGRPGRRSALPKTTARVIKISCNTMLLHLLACVSQKIANSCTVLAIRLHKICPPYFAILRGPQPPNTSHQPSPLQPSPGQPELQNDHGFSFFFLIIGFSMVFNVFAE